MSFWSRLELGVLSWLQRASWGSSSFSLRCVEDGGTGLVAFEEFQGKRRRLLIGGIFIFAKEPRSNFFSDYGISGQ